MRTNTVVPWRSPSCRVPARARRAALALALVALAPLLGSAAAQDGAASHDVAVAIPQVLRLRLDAGSAGAAADVPLLIRVEDGGWRIDPASTRVEVLANGGWRLSAAWAPETGDARLRYEVDGRWTDAAPWPVALAEGGATRGWTPVEVGYGLASVPADGDHHGVVTYTLARP